jgi:hypothetical protein
MGHAIRRAEIDELVEVILDTGLFQDGQHHKTANRRADGESIWTGYLVNIISCFSSPSTRHVFCDDCGLPRDMFPKEGEE